MSWKVIKPVPFNPYEINGVKYKNSIELVLRIEELEKENAELKKKIGIYQKGMYNEIEKRDKQLAQAKEIIQTYFDMGNMWTTSSNDFWEITERAKKFLEDNK